ncbi:UbiA family prenyltransferase [Cereibacter azotoformans]|uniref:UbiA family prenyltransferase n=1 Tax=Cereibacter azotoformans TaxID=43057 RepID=UPI000C6E7D8C|nr:UbiA family prenyltransferase [Cereibacter azotoformans]
MESDTLSAHSRSFPDPAPLPVAAAISPVLVVDLDGTLLASDMLHETFWSAVGRDWTIPVRAGLALLRGKAALKRVLAASAAVDVTLLPYDPGVIAEIAAWRDGGGRVVLVTASDQALAEAIAAHLGLFDETHGSDGAQNLKGPVKAAFLNARFGAGCYAYMGDSAADLEVWRHAARAITVNAPADLRRRAEALGVETAHLETRPRTAGPYLRALRPHQWLKNLLVFIPMLAAHDLSAGTVAASLVAFLGFSLIASSVYVINDLIDLDADRAHPRKRRRPFASGAVPITQGGALGLGLIAAGALAALALGPLFAAVMLGYLVATFAYSFVLKRRAIVDICVLAGLYTIRIIAGGAATGIELSVWLLAFSMFFFLSLAAVKRQAELIDTLRRGQEIARGRGYRVEDLPVVGAMSVAAGYVSVLVMALYVNAAGVVELYPHPAALWGICAVLLYWLSRTALITHRGEMHDDPVIFAARDRVSRICGLVILGFALVASGRLV